jgi:hypothetical protein
MQGCDGTPLFHIFDEITTAAANDLPILAVMMASTLPDIAFRWRQRTVAEIIKDT